MPFDLNANGIFIYRKLTSCSLITKSQLINSLNFIKKEGIP